MHPKTCFHLDNNLSIFFYQWVIVVHIYMSYTTMSWMHFLQRKSLMDLKVTTVPYVLFWKLFSGNGQKWLKTHLPALNIDIKMYAILITTRLCPHTKWLSKRWAFIVFIEKYLHVKDLPPNILFLQSRNFPLVTFSLYILIIHA